MGNVTQIRRMDKEAIKKESKKREKAALERLFGKIRPGFITRDLDANVPKLMHEIAVVSHHLGRLVSIASGFSNSNVDDIVDAMFGAGLEEGTPKTDS